MRDNRHHKMFHFSVFLSFVHLKSGILSPLKLKGCQNQTVCCTERMSQLTTLSIPNKMSNINASTCQLNTTFLQNFLFFRLIFVCFFSSFFLQTKYKINKRTVFVFTLKSDMVVALKLIKFTTHFRCDFWLALTTCGWHWRSGSQTCCMRKIKEKTTHQ